MTDDEIDAAAKHAYDLGYRAGMLRAAQIARDEAATVDHQHAHYRMGCVSVAISIERAAGGEG